MLAVKPRGTTANTEVVVQDHETAVIGGLMQRTGTCAVGGFPANTLRLHDMAGNVSEWVFDWYADDLSEAVDYHGPGDGAATGGAGGFLDDQGCWVHAYARRFVCPACRTTRAYTRNTQPPPLMMQSL